ncbi:hypothetical protein [Maridesulfovibrio sp.]|uniref:hypothetical protein n=1 Tax=Maridesulfovibrio sp. TaxID=2795000 RepID=UPI003BAC376C
MADALAIGIRIITAWVLCAGMRVIWSGNMNYNINLYGKCFTSGMNFSEEKAHSLCLKKDFYYK